MKRPRLVAALFVAAALGIAGTLVVRAGLANTTDTPQVVGVPLGGGRYLGGSGPAAGRGADPRVTRTHGPTVLDCYRWSDTVYTQTHDPQSPQCRADWDFTRSDPGKSAASVRDGVIRIGVTRTTPLLDALAAYVNTHYQLYGRSIDFVATGGINSAANQAAAAARADELGVFIGTDIDPVNGSQPVDADAYLGALRAHGVIGVVLDGVQWDATLDDAAPYAWTVFPTAQQTSQRLADVACRTLADQPARGSSDYAEDPRVFGIVTTEAWELPDRIRDPEQVQQSLQDTCGIDADIYPLRATQTGASDPSDAGRDRGTFERMKADGITTVIDLSYLPTFTFKQAPAADAADYHPEWLLPEGRDMVSTAVSGPPQQDIFDSTLILNTANGVVPDTSTTSYTAYTLGGATPAQFAEDVYYDNHYRVVAMIAAAIQEAGPDLTPESFAAGLESARFPNVEAGRAPYFQANVGFGSGNHTLVQDAALGWYRQFKPDAAQYDAGVRLCFLKDGRRYGYDNQFPDSDKGLFAHVDADRCQPR